MCQSRSCSFPVNSGGLSKTRFVELRFFVPIPETGPQVLVYAVAPAAVGYGFLGCLDAHLRSFARQIPSAASDPIVRSAYREVCL